MYKFLFSLLFVIASVTLHAQDDILVLKDGTQRSGKLVSSTDQISLGFTFSERNGQTISYTLDQVSKIIIPNREKEFHVITPTPESKAKFYELKAAGNVNFFVNESELVLQRKNGEYVLLSPAKYRQELELQLQLPGDNKSARLARQLAKAKLKPNSITNLVSFYNELEQNPKAEYIKLNKVWAFRPHLITSYGQYAFSYAADITDPGFDDEDKTFAFSTEFGLGLDFIFFGSFILNAGYRQISPFSLQNNLVPVATGIEQRQLFVDANYWQWFVGGGYEHDFGKVHALIGAEFVFTNMEKTNIFRDNTIFVPQPLSLGDKLFGERIKLGIGYEVSPQVQITLSAFSQFQTNQKYVERRSQFLYSDARGLELHLGYRL